MCSRAEVTTRSLPFLSKQSRRRRDLQTLRQFCLLSCNSRFHSMPTASGKASQANVKEAISCIWAPLGPQGSSFVASRTFLEECNIFWYFFLGIKQHYLRLSFCIVHNNIGGLVHKLSNLKQYINQALLVDHILFGFSTSLFFSVFNH